MVNEIGRMQELARITNLHDVNRLLHDVVARERACDAELVRGRAMGRPRAPGRSRSAGIAPAGLLER